VTCWVWYRKIPNHDVPSGDVSPSATGLFNLSLNFRSVAVMPVSGKKNGPQPQGMAAADNAGLQNQGWELGILKGLHPRPVAGCKCWSMHFMGVL
jgi:hypothetical protein